jgi:hypothetical protein
MYKKHLMIAVAATTLTWNIGLSKADDHGTSEEAAPASPVKTRAIYDNQFNPSVGIVLNGKLTEFSAATSEFAGFGVEEEGERSREGIQIDESEINFSASVDDKFYGSITAAIVREDGSDIVELEEAYGLTLPGSGLPTGLAAKMGRAFWTLGYLNEHHAHADDFADRPLPYRVYLNKAFNDDGIELSYILPTDIYAEVGGGSFRGDDFPLGGGDGEILRQWSAYARIGGDIGLNQSWRAGGYMLSGNPTGGRTSNEDAVTFIGDSDLLAADFRYTLAPTGNPNAQEVTLQGEYFYRDESGTYQDTGSTTGAVLFSDSSKGWYAQAVYKFNQQWRIGTRYSRLTAADVPAGLAGSTLDASGHDPKAYAAMIDWTNSEFSRIRFQYNHEKLTAGLSDNQMILQYVMSIGAHGAHKY